MLEWKFGGWRRGKVVCHLHIGLRGDLKRDETRVLSGVVYMTKSRRPRSEPWGTPQRQVCEEEKSLGLLHLTRKQRDER